MKTLRYLLPGAAVTVALLAGSALGAEDRDRDTPNYGTRDTTQMRSQARAGYPEHFVGLGKAKEASNLIGMSVQNNQNQKLGDVEDMIIDLKSGRVAYLIVGYGGVFGLGERHVAVPPGSFQFSADRKHLTLDADRARLEQAPQFATKDWQNLSSTSWGRSVYSYFNQKPYWTDNDQRIDVVAAGYLNKASNIIGMDVRNNNNDKLGDVEDLAIDLHSGRVTYVFLDPQGFSAGKFVAIPPTVFKVSNDNKALMLDSTRERLEAAPQLSKDQWLGGTDQRWGTEVYRYYNQPPYWLDRDVDREVRGDVDRARENVRESVRDLNENARLDAARDSSQRIQTAIRQDNTLSGVANAVTVTASGDRITLAGTVQTEEQKKHIEAKAKQLAGDAKVDNKIEVRQNRNN